MATKLLSERRTIHQYQNKPVPQNVLQEILDLALISPTANNIEGLDVLAVSNKIKLQKASYAVLIQIEPSARPYFDGRKATYGVTDVINCGAPTVFVIYKNERYDEAFGREDAGIMGMSIVVAARAKGLETMFLGLYTLGNKSGVDDLLGFPKKVFF
jgi:nitroreductase